MRTVPTIRVADTADAVVLPDLPEEIALALTDIAGAAREGLLAMSVAAGMAVMRALFEAEIAEVAGPKQFGDLGVDASGQESVQSVPGQVGGAAETNGCQQGPQFFLDDPGGQDLRARVLGLDLVLHLRKASLRQAFPNT
jgi:hypothetical protein